MPRKIACQCFAETRSKMLKYGSQWYRPCRCMLAIGHKGGHHFETIGSDYWTRLAKRREGDAAAIEATKIGAK